MTSYANYSVHSQRFQTETLLCLYRRIMDSIHDGGSIFYCKGRLEAYAVVARLASELRTANLGILARPDIDCQS